MALRSAVFLSIVLAAAVPPGLTAEFLLQVTGGESTSFSGAYELVEADGSVASVRIEGTVPAHYRFNGRAVSLRLNAAGGSLTAHLYQDGRLVGQGMASGDRGHVALSAGAAPGGKGRGYGYGGAPGR